MASPAPRRTPHGRALGVILEIDPRSAVPPYEQLRQQVTALVLGGALTPGAASPRSASSPTTLDWPAERWHGPIANSSPTGS